MSNKKNVGIYRKFKVERTDRSPKHQNCSYFVLDLDHDPFAVPVLRAYANACREAYPALAEDLDKFIELPVPAFPKDPWDEKQVPVYCPLPPWPTAIPSVGEQCSECASMASHAYSDSTTPGFHFTECDKHREARKGKDASQKS